MCRNDRSKKIILTTQAESKRELAFKIGGDEFDVVCPHCGETHTYKVDEVVAVPGPIHNWILGLIIGGFIGMFLGPFGVIAGACIGMLIGSAYDKMDYDRAKRFNRGVMGCRQ